MPHEQIQAQQYPNYHSTDSTEQQQSASTFAPETVGGDTQQRTKEVNAKQRDGGNVAEQKEAKQTLVKIGGKYEKERKRHGDGQKVDEIRSRSQNTIAATNSEATRKTTSRSDGDNQVALPQLAMAKLAAIE